MSNRWDSLDEPDQLALSRAALDRAITIVAGRAESLASEMELGAVADRGGAEALRLFAILTRVARPSPERERAIGMRGQIGHG
nr:hypothetical protein [uncultured Lichenicoccus sp.]